MSTARPAPRAHPRAPRIVIAVALLLALPSIAIGFFSDDRVLIGSLEQRFAYNAPWWDLYRLIPADAHDVLLARGIVPWWAAPHLHLRLLRPLASALFTLDHALFGGNPLGYHLHSLLWFAALLLAARAAFARFLPQPTATIALAVFAFSGANVYPYGWPSARHGLIAAVFAIGGLLLHVRGREGARAATWLAQVAFIVGLFASEAALGGILFAVAYDLAGPGGHSLRDRVRRALPLLALAFVYLAIYAAIGAGARDSGGYYSPLNAPVQFARAALVRLPVFLANGLLGVPSELATIGAATALAIAGVVAAIAFAGAWRLIGPSPEERASVRWLMLGALLALAPALGAYPGARVLELPNLGFAALIAALVRGAFASGPRAIGRRIAGGLLVLLHLVLAPLASLGNVAATIDMRKKTEAVADDALTVMGASPRAFVIGSDPMVTVYAPATLASQGRARGCWAWIAGAKADAKVTRTGPASIAIEPVGTTFMHGAFETVYRDPSIPWHEGDGATVCGGRVRVLALEGSLPKRIELRVDETLDTPDVALLAWDNGALRRIVPPPAGESVTIAWAKGPSGAF